MQLSSVLCRKVPSVLLISMLLCTASLAGVTNPDISALATARLFLTDNKADSLNRNRPQFAYDETEINLDAALNPYAHGTFVISIAEDGVEVEEGFVTINRGLPNGIALKLGKYRVGFGKLNQAHPHAYPFIDRFGVLAAYLPGDEAFNDVGGQASYRLPLPGDLSSTVSLDVLQGNSFHPDEDGSRMAVLGRWANFFTLKGLSSMEIGVSATQGTNNVAAKTKSTIVGADAKAKLWTNARDFVILQAEVLSLSREDMVNESKKTTSAAGGYFFADYNFNKRWNLGLKAENFQQPYEDENGGKPKHSAVGLFAGMTLMEETTLFRLVWDRQIPDKSEGDPYNTFTLQVLFSMGPHKAHQF